MVRQRGDQSTFDLFERPLPEPTVSFKAEEVRAASIAAKFCKAISLALKECGLSRDEVAARMSAYLGEQVSKAMIDAYTSEARETHNINVARFEALVHATGDFRLLSLMAERFGMIVVDKKYRHWINAAMAKDKADELHRLADAELRAAKAGGI